MMLTMLHGNVNILILMDMHSLCQRAIQYHGLIDFDDNGGDEDKDELEEEA